MRAVNGQHIIQNQLPLFVAVVCASVRNIRDIIGNSLSRLTKSIPFNYTGLQRSQLLSVFPVNQTSADNV